MVLKGNISGFCWPVCLLLIFKNFKMNKIFRNKNLLLCGFFGGLDINEFDVQKYKEARGLYIEDPWERVKSIFLKDDFGNWHPELTYALQNTQIGALVGAVYGGITVAPYEKEKYLRATETNIFANKRVALRHYFDHSMKSFYKGTVKYAPKFAFFCGSFSFTSSCCALYRNKHGILENTLAGFLTGGLCKLSFGIKGFISGGIIGGLLGTVYGIILCGTEKLINKDRVELKYVQFAYSQNRKRLANSAGANENLDINKYQSFHVSHANDPLNQLETQENDVPETEEDKKNS